MPLLFVHGVNNRFGPAYEAGLKVKVDCFKRCFAGAKINGKIFGPSPVAVFPYWGDLAAQFAWNMASLPRGEMQALGATTEPDYRALLAHLKDATSGALTSEPLLSLAKRDFGNAVELLSAMALDHAEPGQEADLAKLVVAAQEFAAANPRPPWIDQLTTDNQLLARLLSAIQAPSGVQAQGLSDILNALSTIVGKLKTAVVDLAGTAVDRVGDFASTKLLGWAREPLNGVLGRFFGDVFIYFDARGRKGSPGPIPQTILTALDTAIANAPTAEPLVIIGHSLGGVITFDLLGHFRPELQVDLFVSVGSQIAHFEEMKLYRESDSTVKAPARAKTPPNIHRWINVYDEVDIFAYAAKGVFDRVDIDARYDTKTNVIKAHGAYFDQARFYQRLRTRIDALP